MNNTNVYDKYKVMVLTKQALDAIDRTEIRLRLAMALGFTEQWIIKSISQNKNNGILTTAKALEVITECTKMKQSEILVDSIIK
jgi:hypothetical protein